MRSIFRTAAFAALVFYVYVRYVRGWYMRWGATDEEVSKPLRGDELAPDPRIESTRAITIDAPPESVWPWLVQIGYGRGGFYSYDLLENVVTRVAGMRAHYRSVDELRPELQTLREGDFIASAPQDWRGGRYAGKLGWTVAMLERPRVMALEGWGAFVLEPMEGGRTRMIVRSRGGQGRRDLLMWAPWELPHFVMERRMLLGIKERAERAAREKREKAAPQAALP